MSHIAVTLAASSTSRKATESGGTLGMPKFDWVLLRTPMMLSPNYASNEKDPDVDVLTGDGGIISKHKLPSLLL